MEAWYDVWDRNDYDHDGNFNEPDGYIDHFQIVHAGGDQADGDPYQGEDAIWSHRSKAYPQLKGQVGPASNKDGGVQIGNTGVWVADYTMQPENGGVSVFAHEYAHDLGLPDEYDTAAATGTQENAVNWWSIMAQSRVSAAGEPGLGTRAADFGAWDKLQLGWLDYEVVPAGQTKALDLGPHEYNSAKAQGVVMPLPKKVVTTQLGAPHGGSNQWWSGQGDERESTLTRSVTLPAGSATLSFWARWNIEDCGPDPCDYAYVEVDDGSGFKPIAGSITNAAEGNGIDGYHPDWTQATFDLSAFAGKTVSLRIRYTTDPAQQGTDTTKPAGIFADDFTLTAGGSTVFTDGAESGNNGWTPDKFEIVGASKSVAYDNYYVASNRQYVSYDQYLKTGPYNAADRGAAELVRALRVPGRPDRLVLEHAVLRQQRERPSGRGRDPRDRLPPGPDLPPRRREVAAAHPDLRCAVLAREGGLVHAPHAERAAELHPRPGRRAGVRRPALLLERPAAERRREGPERGRADRGAKAGRHRDAHPHQQHEAAGELDRHRGREVSSRPR